MNSSRLLHTHFPYCLERLDDGRWVALNRSYKPLGMTVPVTTWVDYTDGPYQITFKRGELDEETLSLVATSVQRDEDGEPQRVYLYADACVPTTGAVHMAAYLERLAALSGLKVESVAT